MAAAVLVLDGHLLFLNAVIVDLLLLFWLVIFVFMMSLLSLWLFIL